MTALRLELRRSPLRLELRRSPLRWWLPLLLAVAVAALFGRQTYWIGVWPQTLAAAQTAASFAAPLAAAASAWAGGRDRRAGVDTDLLPAAVRPVWRVHAARLSASLAYTLAVPAATSLLAAVLSAGSAGAHFFWPGYALLAVILTVAATGLGHLLGRALPGYAAAPLAAVVTYGLILFGNSHGFPLVALGGQPSVLLAPSALAVRAALAAALLLAAVLVPSRRIRDRVVGATAAVVLLAAGTAGAVTAGPLQQPRAYTGGMVCTGTVPDVCVWPEHAGHVAELTGQARRLAELTEFLDLPGAFYEENLRPGDPAVFAVIGESSWSAANLIVAAAARRSVLGRCEAPAVDAAAWWDAVEALDAWLTARVYGGARPDGIAGGSVDAEAAVTVVLAFPPDAQTAWARERLRAVEAHGC